MKEGILIAVQRIHANAKLPEFQTEGSAGADLYTIEDVHIPPEIPTLLPLGFKVEIPKGYEMQIRPRSGMALKGWTIWNSPGTIDSDYRGEVGVIVYKALLSYYNGRGKEEIPNKGFHIPAGTRIAQAVIAKIPNVEYVDVEDLSVTVRGDGGFGSTN